MSFKIAYCAGHHLGNPKGVPKSMGLGDIREWTINDQVARHFAEAASQYEGVETLRTDDPTGKTLIDIPERCAAANEWGADVYIDMHHNAGIEGGTGGGAVAFYRPKDARSEAYANAIYDAVIAAGGLRGNRYDTVIAKNWLTMKHSEADAVLMEYGFMDSKVDAPIIVTDAYSKLVAYATMGGIAKVVGLKNKKTMEVCKVDLPILNKGDKGEAVKAMQGLLELRGFPCGKGATGNFGNGTESAVKKFQKSNKIKETGCCNEKTWKELLGV